jgi:YVTN family beta-propeller protein
MMTRRDHHWACSPLALVALSLPFLLGALSGGSVTAAAEPSSVVYVTSERSGSIAVVDGGSLQVVQDIQVGDRPHNLEVTKKGLLVIATQANNAVSVVDPGTDPPTVSRINIAAPPHDLALAEDGRTVYVVSERGLLSRLDPFSGRVLEKAEIEGDPHNVIVSGETAWITDVSSRRILVVDPDLPVHELPISIVGHDLALRPVSDELWITPWSRNRIVIVDTNTRKQIADLQMGRDPSHKHIAFTEDGSEAWITEPSSGSLFVVDALARRVLERIDLGGHPHHLRFDAGRAYVAVGPDGLVVLDVRTRRVISRVTVGSEVHEVGLRAGG